ncbi:hypothetical protein B0T16DRAFT_455643 [Cercophora newfieldiana]|uniref:Uncharacterized protein n=1 Tax=Cercophora newfieldiana TaxID=92897 RepID=A0AA39YAY0_9PEZI|nr:hypothetical protein B0T16DRAFT_455643 [Cercophora newfieldiana]
MRVFQPECTLPERGPAFIQQPNVRSTMDIVWSALVIIFLCTWSITHLSVPPQVRLLPPAKSFWEDCRRDILEVWYPFRRKALWMLFNILVPEYVFSKALVDHLGARRGTKIILDFQSGEKRDDEVDWTLTHTHFANMGGVFVRFDSDGIDPSATEGPGSSIQYMKQLIDCCKEGYRGLGPFDWSVHKAHYNMGKRWLDEHDDEHVDRESARALVGDVWVLSSAQLLEARKLGIIEKLPRRITRAEINDKNKGDGLVKTLAVIQVLWLVIQLIIRAKMGRQSSQIEITALAFAVCALITYLLLLSRPKDVYTPIVINAVRDADFDEFCKIVRLSQPTFMMSGCGYTMETTARPYVGEDRDRYGDMLAVGLCGGLSIFGAVHLIAWNFDYPNDGERLAWRISALVVTFLPIIVMALERGWNEPTWANGGCLKSTVFHTCLIVSSVMKFVVFPVARLYLLVEALRSTYFLPPTTYAATWANNIPHIG